MIQMKHHCLDASTVKLQQPTFRKTEESIPSPAPSLPLGATPSPPLSATTRSSAPSLTSEAESSQTPDETTTSPSITSSQISEGEGSQSSEDRSLILVAEDPSRANLGTNQKMPLDFEMMPDLTRYQYIISSSSML